MVRVQFSKKSITDIRVVPSASSFNNTGGLCGLWDGNKSNDLYVLDRDGLNQFNANLGSIESYWK